MCNLRNASSKESQVLGSPPYQKKNFLSKIVYFCTNSFFYKFVGHQRKIKAGSTVSEYMNEYLLNNGIFLHDNQKYDLE